MVNDGSEDASADIAQKYTETDPRVLLHSYPENRRWAAVNESIESLKDTLGEARAM